MMWPPAFLQIIVTQHMRVYHSSVPNSRDNWLSKAQYYQKYNN